MQRNRAFALIATFCVAGVLSAQTSTTQPRVKGVFEPVSYGEDIDFTDVFFVSPTVGWVVGKGGTIIHTKDAGKTWTAQLGGTPGSNEPTVRIIRFLDERHGWAVMGTKMLRTTDGESWEDVGTLPYGVTDVAFISNNIGYIGAKETESSRFPSLIYQTRDGGATWNPVWSCSAKVSIGGVNRNVGCHVTHFNFVNEDLGYAALAQDCFGMGCEPPPLIGITRDGGSTWEAKVGPGIIDKDGVSSIAFVDAKKGFARLTGKKLQMTTDGGATWRGIVATPGVGLKFADPEVGWAIDIGLGEDAISYTVDGGQRWTKPSSKFPEWIRAWSFPRRDRAYVVGDHGMVFRYSVVPASRAPVPNEIGAPAMPAFDTQLSEQVAQLEQVVSELRATIGVAATGAPGAVDSIGARGPGGVESPAGIGGATDQIAAPLATPSSFTEGCCKKSFSRLEVVVGALAKTLPEFIGKYKNLNMLVAALRMGSEFPNQFRSVKSGLNAFRQAQDKDAATQALASVGAALSSFKQTTAVVMQKQLPPTGQ